MMEPRGRGKVHDAIVGGAAGEVRAALLGKSFDQHALRRAEHARADRACLAVELLLKTLQALELFFSRGGVGELGRGRARPRAVDEGERSVEVGVAREP